MDNTRLIVCFFGLLLVGCASNVDDAQRMHECNYEGSTFYCQKDESCGPGFCNPPGICGLGAKQCLPTEACVNDQCVCLATGSACSHTCCGTGCFDTLTDPNNCGVCGNVCQKGEFCSDGVCTMVCQKPLEECTVDGVRACYDLNNDANHCGSCMGGCLGAASELHQVSSICKSGRCEPICEAGWTDANKDASDGCEFLRGWHRAQR